MAAQPKRIKPVPTRIAKRRVVRGAIYHYTPILHCLSFGPKQVSFNTNQAGENLLLTAVKSIFMNFPACTVEVNHLPAIAAKGRSQYCSTDLIRRNKLASVKHR